MDTQVAWNPRGYLHAVAPVHSEDLAAAFLATMTRQGCQVERLTEAEHRARFQLPKRTPAPDPAESCPPPAPAPSAAPDPQLDEIPETGTELVHPLLGVATVTHHVTLPDGQRLAVARGRAGEGLVRAWSPVLQVAPEPVPAPPPPRLVGPSVMPSLF